MDAYAKSKTPPNARDRRGTPPGLVQLISKRTKLEFVRDVCAEPGTSQADRYWSEEADALTKEWAYWYWIDTSEGDHERLPAYWMNPPYSDPSPWIEKAIREAANGCITVGLLPDDRSTGWYQTLRAHASGMLVADRRLPFLDEHGIPQFGNPKGSIIPIFAPWQLGWVEQTLRIPAELMKQWRTIRKQL